jgi:hypothetical protein
LIVTCRQNENIAYMKNAWPILQFEDLKDTIATVQLWTQMVGKIRLVKMPWLNHSWHVTFYVSPRGLTTGSIPYENGIFEIAFDFIAHELLITASTGENKRMKLCACTIAGFYKELFDALALMDIAAEIFPKPNEIEPAIPFAADETPRIYNEKQMVLFWHALVNIHNVFTRFRACFIGKCSPVHFFWGGFDLAVTRFSGRTAPAHPGGVPNMSLKVMQEAYSHEVSSCGFWPGSEASPYPVFYAYCYPTPASFGEQPVEPKQAFYSQEMGEFFLPYEEVRNAEDPEAFLTAFLQSTYEAAANTGNWDRQALEADFSSFEKN